MVEINEYLRQFSEMVKKTKELEKSIKAIQGIDFASDEILQATASMFNRFCPFVVGQHVMLREDIEMGSFNPGWHHCAHFMKADAWVKILTRGYNHGYFSFAVEFLNESWVDSEGKEHLSIDKSSFQLFENQLYQRTGTHCA